jgi:hypothetical protein
MALQGLSIPYYDQMTGALESGMGPHIPVACLRSSSVPSKGLVTQVSLTRALRAANDVLTVCNDYLLKVAGPLPTGSVTVRYNHCILLFPSSWIITACTLRNRAEKQHHSEATISRLRVEREGKPPTTLIGCHSGDTLPSHASRTCLVLTGVEPVTRRLAGATRGAL